MAEAPADIGLAVALEALRAELEDAWAASEGQRVRFQVADVTLTLEVVARREKGGGGKLRWWLIEAGGEVKAARETTQTLVLTLTPSLYDDVAKEPLPGG